MEPHTVFIQQVQRVPRAGGHSRRWVWGKSGAGAVQHNHGGVPAFCPPGGAVCLPPQGSKTSRGKCLRHIPTRPGLSHLPGAGGRVRAESTSGWGAPRACWVCDREMATPTVRAAVLTTPPAKRWLRVNTVSSTCPAPPSSLFPITL